MVLMHVWPSGIKALPDTNSYFYTGSSTKIETKYLFLLALNMSFDT
jgi:hypothetical protein